MDPRHLDLLQPDLQVSPQADEMFAWLRDNDPVHWQSGIPGFWSVTRHADVISVMRDQHHYTSLNGNMLETLLQGHDPGSGKMLVVSDGEYHQTLRRVLVRDFGSKALAPIADAVANATSELLDELVSRGEGDFVAEVAAQVPLRAICMLLGVPAADQDRILQLTNAAMLSGDPSEGSGGEARRARSEIFAYYMDLASERRHAPGSDIVSALVRADIGGRKLTDEEVLLNCYNLVIGGDETARLALAGGVLALLSHPEEWALLRERADVVNSAVEEVLRWTTPARHVGRMVSADVDLGGQELRVGEVVALWMASANRDPLAFDAPDVFDLTRTPNPHLTFGRGHHFCIGAELARVEVRALIKQLRRTVASIELVGRPTHIPSIFISGLEHLPIRVQPA